MGGHLGRDKTIQKAQKDFYWLGMKSEVRAYIRNCEVCQQYKSYYAFLNGLLQALPIPSKPLTHTMDFGCRPED